MSRLCLSSRVPDGVSYTVVAEAIGQSTALNYRLFSAFDIEDWFLELTGPRHVIGVFGGRVDAVGPDRFRIVPDVWTRTLAANTPVDLSVLVA